jgi:hypothetical protein
MTEYHDPEKELHGIKSHLMEVKEDLHDVVHGIAETVRHYGHWNEHTAKEMVDEIDGRLGRAISGAEVHGHGETAAGLAVIRSDLNNHDTIGVGRADHDTIRAIEEFHDRVDEHLEFLRKSGREW